MSSPSPVIKMAYVVTLYGGAPWGFRIQGGAENDERIYISKVNPNSKAYREGIQVGDVVHLINRENTEGLSLIAAQKQIKSAGNTLELELKRGEDIHHVDNNRRLATKKTAGTQPAKQPLVTKTKQNNAQKQEEEDNMYQSSTSINMRSSQPVTDLNDGYQSDSKAPQQWQHFSSGTARFHLQPTQQQPPPPRLSASERQARRLARRARHFEGQQQRNISKSYKPVSFGVNNNSGELNSETTSQRSSKSPSIASSGMTIQLDSLMAKDNNAQAMSKGKAMFLRQQERLKETFDENEDNKENDDSSSTTTKQQPLPTPPPSPQKSPSIGKLTTIHEGTTPWNRQRSGSEITRRPQSPSILKKPDWKPDPRSPSPTKISWKLTDGNANSNVVAETSAWQKSEQNKNSYNTTTNEVNDLEDVRRRAERDFLSMHLSHAKTLEVESRLKDDNVDLTDHNLNVSNVDPPSRRVNSQASSSSLKPTITTTTTSTSSTPYIPSLNVTINSKETADSGIWTPGKMSLLDQYSKELEEREKQREKDRDKQQTQQLKDAYIWSPSGDIVRKEFKPVKLQTPSKSPEKSITDQTPPPKPEESFAWKPPERPSSTPIFANGTTHIKVAENKAGLHLPPTQSPMITILQKTRVKPNNENDSAYLSSNQTSVTRNSKVSEGHIPKGAIYMGTKETREGDVKHKDEYYLIPGKKVVDKTTVEKKAPHYEGVGPINEQGVPIAMRSTIDEKNHHDWYKNFYKTLHKPDKPKGEGEAEEESDDEYEGWDLTDEHYTSDTVIIARPSINGSNNHDHNDDCDHQSEENPYRPTYVFPEATDPAFEEEARKWLDDDIFKRSATLPNKRTRSKSFTESFNEPRSPPWVPPSATARINVYKNQPRSIEDYEPGYSSLAEREKLKQSRRLIDSPIYRSVIPPQRSISQGNLHNPPVGKPGDHSQYILDDRKVPSGRLSANNSRSVSPTQQHDWYVQVQRGGDIPLSGFRKPAPERRVLGQLALTDLTNYIIVKLSIPRLISRIWPNDKFYDFERKSRDLVVCASLSDRAKISNKMQQPFSPRFDRKTLNEFEASKRDQPQRGISARLNQFKEKREKHKKPRRRGEFGFKNREKPKDRVLDRVLQYESGDSRDTSRCTSTENLSIRWFSNDSLSESVYSKSMESLIRRDDIDENNRSPALRHNSNVSSSLEEEFTRPEVRALLRKYNPDSYEDRFRQLAIFNNDQNEDRAEDYPEDYPDTDFVDYQREDYRNRVEEHYKRLTSQEDQPLDDSDVITEIHRTYHPGIDNDVWKAVDHERRLSFDKTNSSETLDLSGKISVPIHRNRDQKHSPVLRRGGEYSRCKSVEDLSNKTRNNLNASTSDLHKKHRENHRSSHVTDNNRMRDLTDENKRDAMKATSVSNHHRMTKPPISIHSRINNGNGSTSEIIGSSVTGPNVSIDSIDDVRKTDSNNRVQNLNWSDDSLERSTVLRDRNRRELNSSDDSLERSSSSSWNPNVLGVDLYQSRVNMVKRGAASTTSECSERSTMSRLDPQTYQSYAAGIVQSTRKSTHFTKMQKRFGNLERISQIEKDLQQKPTTNRRTATSLPRTLKSIKMIKANRDCEKMALKPEEEELCSLYDDLDGAQKRNEFLYRTTKAGTEWEPRLDRSLMKRSKSVGDIKKVYDEGGVANENTRVVKPDYQVKPGFKRDLSFVKLREKYKQLDDETQRDQSFLDFVEAQKKLAAAEDASSAKSGSYIQIMENAANSAKIRPLYRAGEDEKVNPYEVYVTNLKKSKSEPDMDNNLHVRSVSAPYKPKEVVEKDRPQLDLSNSYRASDFSSENPSVEEAKKFWQNERDTPPVRVVAPVLKSDENAKSTYQLQREPITSPAWKRADTRPQPVRVTSTIVLERSGNLSNMPSASKVPEYRDRPDGHSSPIPPPLRTSSPFIDDASHPPPLPLSSPPSIDIHRLNDRESIPAKKLGVVKQPERVKQPIVSNPHGRISPIISSGSSTPPALFQMVLGRKWEPTSDNSGEQQPAMMQRDEHRIQPSKEIPRKYSPVYAMPWDRYKRSDNDLNPSNNNEQNIQQTDSTSISDRKSPIYSKPSKTVGSPAVPPRKFSNDLNNKSTPSFEVKDLRKLADNNDFAQTKFSLARGYQKAANLEPYQPSSRDQNNTEMNPTELRTSSSFGSNDTFIFKDEVPSNNNNFLDRAISEDNLTNDAQPQSPTNIWKTKSEPNIAWNGNDKNGPENTEDENDSSEWPVNTVSQLKARFEHGKRNDQLQQYDLRNAKSSPAIVRSAELRRIKSVYENGLDNFNESSSASSNPSLSMPRTVSGDLAEIRKRFENADSFASRPSNGFKTSASVGSLPVYRDDGSDRVEVHAPVQARVKAYRGDHSNDSPHYAYPTHSDNAYEYDHPDNCESYNQTAQSTPPIRKHHLSTSDIPSEVRSPTSTIDRRRRDEEDARRREILRQITEAEKQKKAEEEALKNEARRHSDYFMPKQKSPVPLDRFDDQMIAPPTFDKRRMPEVRGKGKAMYTFKAHGPKELSFRRDDVIYLLRQVDKNWWEAERHGRRGIVPINYIEIVRSLDEARESAFRAEGQAKLKYKFTKQNAMELSAQKGDIVTLLRRVDDNWYEARRDGQTGIIPATYLEVLRDPDMPLLTPAPSIAPSYASSIAPSTATTPGPGTPLRPLSPSWPDDPRGSPNFNSLPNHFMFPEPISPAKYHGDSHSPRATDRSPTRPSGYYNQEQRSPSRTYNKYNSLPHSASHNKDYSPHHVPQQQETNPYHRQSSNKSDYSSEQGTISRIDQYSPQHHPYNNYSSLKRHDKMNYPAGMDRRANDNGTIERERSRSEMNGVVASTAPRGGSRHASSSPRTMGHEKWFDEASYRRREQRQEPERFYEQKVAPPPQPTREKPIELYKAKYKYKPRNDDEMELREGDHIHIIEKCDDGWFVGSNSRTGHVGTFPGNYVERLRD
ncbi:uncharacterized protein LOC141903346 [Tubulanus polymorphus]|uniref:uncharacterized protein LOC141903346 n=1 Tax=Tubulanus polymorphus TaxID=672921 RepID=UPI003DA2CFAC